MEPDSRNSGRDNTIFGSLEPITPPVSDEDRAADKPRASEDRSIDQTRKPGGVGEHALRPGNETDDLGRIRSVETKLPPGSPLLSFDSKSPVAAEQYRMIRTRITQHRNQPRSIVISSAEGGDGKSLSAVLLSRMLALMPETRVLLIDADFRRSSLAGMLGVPDSPGLADVLTERCSLDDAVVQLSTYPNLYFLGIGEKRDDSPELLDSPRWKTLSQETRRRFNFTIVDAPPVGVAADYELLQASCDGVLFVVRQDHTTRAGCAKLMASSPPSKIIGVIMNCVQDWFLSRNLVYYYERSQ